MNKHLLQSFPRSTQDRLTGQRRAGHRPKRVIVVGLTDASVARVVPDSGATSAKRGVVNMEGSILDNLLNRYGGD